MSKFSAPRRTLLKALMSLVLAVPLARHAGAQARKKIVVLGLDAVDPRLLEGFWAQGYCPNLKKLARLGHYGPLQTTHPPMSPAAWSTMTTGLNPGKHGITGFIRRTPGQYEPTMALADINETPMFGGGVANRVGYAFGVALAAFGMAALLGKGGRRIAASLGKHGAPKPHRLVPAASTIALLLTVPVLATAAGPLLAGAGVVALLCLLTLGYSVASGRLKPGEIVVPVLGLASAVFAVLRRFPEEMPQPITGRKGETFWQTLSRHGYRCRVLAAPVDWPAPPHPGAGQLTTGLGTPDAAGTFHMFTLFSEPPHALAGGYTEMGGRVERLVFKGDAAKAALAGPPARFKRELWAQWEAGKLTAMPREEVVFEVRRAENGITLVFEKSQGLAPVSLKVGQWTDHLSVKFDLGGLVSYPGLVRLKLLEAGEGRVRLYATPVTFDPQRTPAAFAVSAPADFAAELAQVHGPYSTLGWPEATSALNDEAIDDQTFLETCEHIFAERERQWLALLDKPDEWDMAACFFYDIDRICHMMWRHMDPRHPAHVAQAAEKFKDKIREAYERSDRLVGEVLKRLPEDCVLLVCSDHGFLPFYRAVNLNRWLINEGYATLRGKADDASMRDLFTGRSGFYGEFDWSKTRAYAMGLGKIYINTRGREPGGIVEPAEAPALMTEIKTKLEALRDQGRDGARVIHEVYLARDIWQDWEGGVPRNESDLEVGFADGYRISWQSTLGGANEDVITDNLRNWSGDHCTFAPELVPGVVLSNRKLAAGASGFRLMDVGDTVLRYFEVPPAHERGKFDGRGWDVL